MGRKIPARKHHGVRDPIRQNQQRLSLIKDKINNPPEKKDFQKVSHTLADFMKLKDDSKSSNNIRKRRIDIEDEPENYKKSKQTHRQNKILPDILRYPNEDEETYIRRVNRVTRESIQESKFEAKYGVEVIRHPQTGEISLKKRPIDELEVQMKKARMEKKKGTKSKKNSTELKLTAEEKKKLVKEMMIKQKMEKSEKEIVEYKRDEVKFGEVVHAPPQLKTPRRGKKAETVRRPGKSNLLLCSLMEGNTAEPPKPPKPIQAPLKIKTVDLKGKRKALPMATRQMLEKEQQNVMEMYRRMKTNPQL